MRRTMASIVLTGLAVAACSFGDDTPGSEIVDEGSLDGANGADDAGAGPDADVVGGSAHALPGLLDPSDEPIPDDDAVRTGMLPNGLRYYIRENDNPGGKAELRLAVRAGSVHELGPSTGVAHFAEHMLFNGTERFPENELIDTLRSFGAAFGADVNASTSFDETVYMLTVPSTDESVELGVTVLSEWLSHATFAADQVVAERGVVLDEWRVRTQSKSGRLLRVASEMFLAGSAYAGRSPIGDDASISAMTDAELLEFYDAWYRPDNAAVVVVGDIDVDEVEADIEQLFGRATPRSEAMPERPDTHFDVDTEPDFALHADPDQQTVDVEVTLPLPSMEGDGTAALRAELLDVMIFEALIRRLDQDVAGGLAPFDRIAQGTNSLVESLDAPALYAFTEAGRVRETLDALLTEYERANRFGFGATETDLARDTVRSYFQARYDGRESTQDRDYADGYVRDFLTGAGFPSIEDEYRIATETLDAVTPAALDLRFRARWANSAPHVIVSAPESVADQMPSRTDVLAAIESVRDGDVATRSGPRDLPDALMERPDPVDPATRELLLPFDDPLFDPIEVVFPNGVAVILNRNDIVEGQVFMQASSPGGSSVVPDEDVVDARYAADIATSSGVGDLNQAELDQVLAGRDVELDAWIEPYREYFAGAAATADVEVLLQLVHLYMTAPRFDEVALDQVRSFVGPVVEDPASAPDLAGEDALAAARYPGEPRYDVLPEPAAFETLDLAGVERVWRDRFGNAADWVFVFAGDFDVDELTELAGSYFGTLPTGDSETWVDVEAPPPAGVVRRTVRAGTGDTATVTVVFTSPVASVDARLRVNADVATEVISARLTDVVREELGESYSPSAITDVTTDPDPVVVTSVRVTGSPARIDAIGELVIDELTQLGVDGPSGREFSNALAQVQEAYNFVNNYDFIVELLDDAVHPALELDDYVATFSELGNVSADSVRDYLDDHVAADQYIQVTVLPR